MSLLHGCHVERIDHQGCRAWLSYVLGESGAPLAWDAPTWLLCHCDGGVTWGRLTERRWQLGSAAFSDLCPTPTERSVQELRVFCRASEVLIWRSGDGLLGRILTDTAPAESSGPLAPHDEPRLLLGGQIVEERDGFTRVRNGAGREQALPLTGLQRPWAEWPRLYVRHYFARDEETGFVRVAVTRLVELK
jgi:CRISPR-associated protein (TIGR03984 family)